MAILKMKMVSVSGQQHNDPLPELQPSQVLLNHISLDSVHIPAHLKKDNNPPGDRFAADSGPEWVDQNDAGMLEKAFAWAMEARYNPADPQNEIASKDSVAWRLALALIDECDAGPKTTMRVLCHWNVIRHVGLSMNKISQIMCNARPFSGAAGRPFSLWQSERFLTERAARPGVRKYISRSTKRLLEHITMGGWNLATMTDREKTAVTHLQNWEEGRRRCGHAYWWREYQSPGLEHLDGAKAWSKTVINCGCPGCSECALFETQNQIGNYDWEGAYGTEFPIKLILHPGNQLNEDGLVTEPCGPLEVKRHLGKWSKRTHVLPTIKGLFGAFLPTAQGYTLQILLPPSRLKNGALQDLVLAWRDYYPAGTIQVVDNYTPRPAIEQAIDLAVAAEREIFRLLDLGHVDPKFAFKCISCWLGEKVGKKGMNRIWHSPGFRQHRQHTPQELTAKFLDSLEPLIPDLSEISPNMHEDMLALNSEKENKLSEFPKTWYSLENGVKQGNKVRVYDPYQQQIAYFDLGKNGFHKLPPEYETIEDPALVRSNLSAGEIWEIEKSRKARRKLERLNPANAGSLAAGHPLQDEKRSLAAELRTIELQREKIHVDELPVPQQQIYQQIINTVAATLPTHNPYLTRPIAAPEPVKDLWSTVNYQTGKNVARAKVNKAYAIQQQVLRQIPNSPDYQRDHGLTVDHFRNTPETIFRNPESSLPAKKRIAPGKPGN